MSSPARESIDPVDVLNTLNGRRFEVFRVLAASPEPLAVVDLAQLLPPQGSGSLHRDLAALEGVHLVTGSPRPEKRQQGQRVLYSASFAPLREVLTYFLQRLS
ncbi:hypothetical protein [Kineococcus sp. SYSU DK003]|uniref:hypothetical protein n=1 Tax=Kineococcus sp. SYSU DK003 TaxID=3383124 RepID=UPI003D7EF563